MLMRLLQTIQSKDGLDDAEDSELQPLSAVELALKLQQQKGPLPGFPALPQASGTDSAAVAAASHGHLHMPFFEKVDIGALLCSETPRGLCSPVHATTDVRARVGCQLLPGCLFLGVWGFGRKMCLSPCSDASVVTPAGHGMRIFLLSGVSVAVKLTVFSDYALDLDSFKA